MQGTNLANGSTTAKRRELDFYPTPANVTQALIDFIQRNITTAPLWVWEPACGDGAMSKVLHLAGYKVTSSDIRETGYGYGGADFLTSHLCAADAIITNPPFKDSVAFITKALQEAPMVAMLLKSQYWHASKRTGLFQDHPPAYVLPLNWRPDFMAGERGGSPTMEVLWTIWLKGETDTRYRVLSKPNDEG